MAAAILCFAIHLFTLASARDCPCGFSVNSTTDAQHQIFTQYLESDFTQNNLDGWSPQEWSIDRTKARGPYGKNASLDNVVLTKEGMQLWVRGQVDDFISTAEVGSKRTDMLYGSFRMRARMGTAHGTCGAMFWYHNNTQEIDMEFLSKQFNETDSSILNLVIQSPESQAAGFNAIYTPGFADPRLLFRSDMAFHDYRFDWTPGQVAFYADDRLLRVMTENIPDSGGHMVFNHWSNGDEGWSAGPPTQDTYMVISHAHFYFNSSDEGAQRDFAKDCPTLMPEDVCQIDDTDITHALMPPIGAEGSSSNPFSPGSTGPWADIPSSPTTPSWTAPDDESFSAEKRRMTTIYIAVGVAVGLAIVIFIGCMMTHRHWMALKNRITRCMSRGSGRHGKSEEGIEMKDDIRLATKTPDTELESQVSPMKSLDARR